MLRTVAAFRIDCHAARSRSIQNREMFNHHYTELRDCARNDEVWKTILSCHVQSQHSSTGFFNLSYFYFLFLKEGEGLEGKTEALQPWIQNQLKYHIHSKLC